MRFWLSNLFFWSFFRLNFRTRVCFNSLLHFLFNQFRLRLWFGNRLFRSICFWCISFCNKKCLFNLFNLVILPIVWLPFWYLLFLLFLLLWLPLTLLLCLLVFLLVLHLFFFFLCLILIFLKLFSWTHFGLWRFKSKLSKYWRMFGSLFYFLFLVVLGFIFLWLILRNSSNVRSLSESKIKGKMLWLFLQNKIPPHLIKIY